MGQPSSIDEHFFGHEAFSQKFLVGRASRPPFIRAAQQSRAGRPPHQTIPFTKALENASILIQHKNLRQGALLFAAIQTVAHQKALFHYKAHVIQGISTPGVPACR